jgi:hypothetical protein
MARALLGQQTHLQRRLAIAVAEMKGKGRRDSAELDKVWWSVGRMWETESEGSLD